jgi:hypothetical protein
MEMLNWLRERPERSSAFMAVYPVSEYDTREPRDQDLPRLDGE